MMFCMTGFSPACRLDRHLFSDRLDSGADPIIRIRQRGSPVLQFWGSWPDTNAMASRAPRNGVAMVPGSNHNDRD